MISPDLPPNLVTKIRINEATGCHEWTGSCMNGGYGNAYDVRTKRMTPAHRLVYELVIGPIQDGLQLDHLCRVRNCVNPSHLEPVTCQTNLERGETRVARKFDTHCQNGHAYTGRNEYRGKANGTRMCRTCLLERTRARMAGTHPTARPCMEDGCETHVWARDRCRKHYKRHLYRLRHGAVESA